MRCYFHLVSCDETITDDLGLEVSDLIEAKAQALIAIHEIREETTECGASWQGWRLEVADQSGRVLFSFPLEPTVQ